MPNIGPRFQRLTQNGQNGQKPLKTWTACRARRSARRATTVLFS